MYNQNPNQENTGSLGIPAPSPGSLPVIGPHKGKTTTLTSRRRDSVLF